MRSKARRKSAVWGASSKSRSMGSEDIAHVFGRSARELLLERDGQQHAVLLREFARSKELLSESRNVRIRGRILRMLRDVGFHRRDQQVDGRDAFAVEDAPCLLQRQNVRAPRHEGLVAIEELLELVVRSVVARERVDL